MDWQETNNNILFGESSLYIFKESNRLKQKTFLFYTSQAINSLKSSIFSILGRASTTDRISKRFSQISNVGDVGEKVTIGIHGVE